MNMTPIYSINAGTQLWIQKADKPGEKPIHFQLSEARLFDASQVLLNPLQDHVSEYFLFWDKAGAMFLWAPFESVIMAEVLVGG